jgi:hypothetical protein
LYQLSQFLRRRRPGGETALDSFYLTILDAKAYLLDQRCEDALPVRILGMGWEAVKLRAGGVGMGERGSPLRARRFTREEQRIKVSFSFDGTPRILKGLRSSKQEELLSQ